ncbi:S1 family peptidase [Thalassotalea agariperforans]
MKRLVSLFIFCFTAQLQAVENAEALFKQLAPSLYQIKLIDIASGEKSSIGSGFQITEDGLVATNYHVISGYARHPEKYKMQYLDQQGNSGELLLKSVDVINDLALVKRAVSAPMPYFKISHDTPIKGEELYSLGNPHDLGMIVVPGTYNGLKAESFNDRIHFTGSVNSGMSGGPVVNKASEVVGINVATSGNQIGFLVPHDKLKILFKQFQSAPPNNIKQQMAEQLSAYQQKLTEQVLAADWQLKRLGQGNAIIPTIDLPYIRCWGNSNADKKDDLYFTVIANCTLDENTYIEGNFFTGSLEMEYRYLQAKELSDTKFYHLYKQRIRQVGPNNQAGKDHVGEFQCHHDIVTPNNHAISNKTIFCTRAYKDFPKLFDVIYLAASVDKHDKALISHFTMSGVEQKNALLFTKKFMEAVSWEQ